MEKLIRYKLLTPSFHTRKGYSNETKWIENEWIEAKGHGGLCTDGVVHFYSSPEIAALMNPVHADINNPVFAELEVEEIVEETQIKGGAKRARIIRIIPSITPTLTQRVAFGILCAKYICKEAGFLSWANGWISGADRSRNAAAKAAEYAAAEWAAYAAAKAAEKAEDAEPNFNLYAIAIIALRNY